MTERAAHSAIETLVREDLNQLLSRIDLSALSDCKILASGCTGFIGYWLLMAIDCLNQGGANIRFTAISRDPAAFLQRHPVFADAKWLRFIETDISDYQPLKTDFDYCIHAATDTRPHKLADQKALLRTVVEGTRRIGEQARLSNVKAMLVVSSGAVYEQGVSPQQPGLLPQDYSQAKWLMEQLAAVYASEGGYRLNIARCFAFVGYLLPPHLAIAQFIDAALYEEHITLSGDGMPVRSYLYAADMAIWLLAALLKGEEGVAYDVGSDDARSLEEHATLVCELLAPQKKLSRKSNGKVGPRNVYVPDISKTTQELGVDVWTDLKTAIGRHAMMKKGHK